MRSASLRDPSASSGPIPSPNAICWITASMASLLPKVSSMPPVSSSVSSPFSKHSMAKAMVPPHERVSMP